MPMRPLGATGVKVSLLGLGGWHVGVSSLTDGEAVRMIRTAIDGGINFLDNAREYNDGRSEERVGTALAGPWRDRVFLMTKSCAHTRNRADSMKSLEESLRALKTDRIDLWLFHEVVYDNDPEWIFTRGGLAAAIQARQQGKVRFLGFSGHKHPDIHLDMLGRPFRWDAVMMPLNVVDAHYRSFEKRVLPEAVKRNLGVIAMKSLGGFMSRLLEQTKLDPEECLRYVMSLPISTVVSGMENPHLLEANLALARRFMPLTEAERTRILAASAPAAGDGRCERYKSTTDFDARPGQAAHGLVK
ncbi:MAG: aldo/keto reductase [Candidatus Riflebacteria bacterium]|nr:aldo/keto reductase [Candidatus Riflebacteria bacterium]